MELKTTLARHSRAGGNPVITDLLESHDRGYWVRALAGTTAAKSVHAEGRRLHFNLRPVIEGAGPGLPARFALERADVIRDAVCRMRPDAGEPHLGAA